MAGACDHLDVEFRELAGRLVTIGRLLARSPERGADTLVWLADSPEVSGISGVYFFDRRQVRPLIAACCSN